MNSTQFARAVSGLILAVVWITTATAQTAAPAPAAATPPAPAAAAPVPAAAPAPAAPLYAPGTADFHVNGADVIRAAPPRTPEQQQADEEAQAAWQVRCRPTTVEDREGIRRTHYAAPDCDLSPFKHGWREIAPRLAAVGDGATLRPPSTAETLLRGQGQPSSLRNWDALRPSRRRNRLRKVTASE